METLKVLLIEDNKLIAYSLKEVLRGTCIIDHVTTGKQGIYRTDTATYDVIILDLTLPDMTGLAVCQQLRERSVRTPILILSAEHRVLTKIQLLDAGANDYLTKPFSLGELKARLRSLSRQNPETILARGLLEVGDLQLDTMARAVRRRGIAISLRPKEFGLLECLMAHAGIVVSRDTLVRYAWKDTASLWTNTVDVHIKYLRDKIDRPFDESIIQTVHGVGYRLVAAKSAQMQPA